MLEKLLMEVLLYNQRENLLWLPRLTCQLCTSMKAIPHFQLSSTPPHSFLSHWQYNVCFERQKNNSKCIKLSLLIHFIKMNDIYSAFLIAQCCLRSAFKAMNKILMFQPWWILISIRNRMILIFTFLLNNNKNVQFYCCSIKM